MKRRIRSFLSQGNIRLYPSLGVAVFALFSAFLVLPFFSTFEARAEPGGIPSLPPIPAEEEPSLGGDDFNLGELPAPAEEEKEAEKKESKAPLEAVKETEAVEEEAKPDLPLAPLPLVEGEQLRASEDADPTLAEPEGLSPEISPEPEKATDIMPEVQKEETVPVDAPDAVKEAPVTAKENPEKPKKEEMSAEAPLTDAQKKERELLHYYMDAFIKEFNAKQQVGSITNVAKEAPKTVPEKEPEAQEEPQVKKAEQETVPSTEGGLDMLGVLDTLENPEAAVEKDTKAKTAATHTKKKAKEDAEDQDDEGPAPVLTAEEQKVLETLLAEIPTLTTTRAKRLMGTCLPMLDKWKSCEPFSCFMPHPFIAGATIERTIIAADKSSGAGDEARCRYDETLPGGMVMECNYKQVTRQALIEDTKALLAGNYSFKPDQLSPAQTVIKRALQRECITHPEGQDIAMEGYQDNVWPNGGKEEGESTDRTRKLKRDLGEDERAYADFIKKKQEELPQEKRLSNDTKETMTNIASVLSEERHDEFAYYDEGISIDRSNRQDTNAPDANSSTIPGLNLQVRDREQGEERVAVNERLDTAFKALLAGQTEAAIDIYKHVLATAPNNEAALFGLATAYHRSGQTDQAREIYVTLLDLNPTHKEALNNFLVLAAEESPEDALLELKKLERIHPDFSPISAQMGMIYARMGDETRAESYLKRAVSLTPDNMSYVYNLAVISDRMHKRGQAISLYTQLVKAEERGAFIPGSIENIQERLNYLNNEPY